MNIKKLVLFGINADPPHLGHLQVILELKKRWSQDAHYVIMPTGPHPSDKRQVASSQDRLAMTQKLFRGYEHVKVDDFEIMQKKHCYTLDTLMHLKGLYPDARLYFVMALDVANNFFSWHEPEKILSIAQPIIVSRQGHLFDQKVMDRLQAYNPNLEIQTQSLPISSTEIRKELKAGLRPKYLTPEVYHYIQEKGLYTK